MNERQFIQGLKCFLGLFFCFVRDVVIIRLFFVSGRKNRGWPVPGPVKRMELIVLFRQRKMNRKQNAVFLIGQPERE
jgi:hypothetical protein